MTTRVKVGVFLPSMAKSQAWTGDVVSAAREAEDLGFESVWVVDQLISGSGSPILDSGIALAAAAAVTTRVGLGYGVMVLPLRQPAWAAKQVASLQYLSGNRVILGVGIGGDRHGRSWAAAGVPRRERARRTDAALAILPSLIRGEPVALDGDATGPSDGEGEGELIKLLPGGPAPQILIGGVSDAALVRAVRFGDGWLALPMPVSALNERTRRLSELAHEQPRVPPSVTATVMVAFVDDPSTPDPGELRRSLSDPAGPFGIPARDVDALVIMGDCRDVANRLAAYVALGVVRLLVDFVAGDWHRQAELLAEAVARLG